jgi:riboflavin synthase
MGAIALDEFKKHGTSCEIVRTTVPGIKDLPVECKILLEEGNCAIVMALGMVGGAPVDQQCAHEASLGIQQAKLMTNKHIIEVFVHENEAWNEQEFREICDNRIRKHVENAVDLVVSPEKLVKRAGQGVRQGKGNEGEITAGANKPITLGFVISEFNTELTTAMEKAAKNYADRQKAVVAAVIRVPGAYDIPLAAKKLLVSDKKIDAVVTLGAIVKGETKHDETIAQAAASALTQLSLEMNKPITLGVIGPGATDEAAEARKTEYAERAVQSALDLVKKLRR